MVTETDNHTNTIKIAIVGRTGYGKSLLADIIKNEIFKKDKNSKIIVIDEDREHKELGNGKNIYEIYVSQNNFNYECDISIDINTNKLANLLK